MPPKANDKEYLIILVNIGCTVEREGGNESFLDKSKLVIKQLIQRKIFLRPRDEVGIITMGAFESQNQLSFDNIAETNSLKIASWDMVESVMKLEGTTKRANWVDGISVALDYINRECLESSVSRTVILLNDFKEDSDVIEQYSANTIAEEIKEADIKLLAICDRSLTGDMETEFNPSEELFHDVCEMVQGQTMTFDDTIPKLMIYKDKPKKAMPWKVDMDLFDINIPVVVYLKVTDDFKPPKLETVTESTQGNGPGEYVQVERNRALVDKDKTVIDPENITTGIMYGRKFIPLSEEDIAAQEYQSGPKGFMIFGFTKRQYITMDCLSGKGSYIVVPEKEWAGPFYSLVKAMADSEKVAIVRRVYRAKVAPKIGVLSPKLDDTPGQPWCLVYVELTFAEDRRRVPENNLTSTVEKLSNDQKAAVDNLIDTMMLTEVEDDSTEEKYEAFEVGTVPNVCRQHIFDMFSHRALNPDAPLPPMSDFLKKFLEPPNSVQEKSTAALNAIGKLFSMELVEKPKKNKAFAQTSDDAEESLSSTQATIADEDSMKVQDSVVENFLNNKTEDDDELCQMIDASSQAMDIDLDDLAKNM